MNDKLKDNIAKYIFFIAALTSVICIVTIMVFIFVNGVPAIFKIGVVDFIFGTKWAPMQKSFGILPMIVASIFVTFFSFLISSYIGKWSAIFLAFYCNKRLYYILKPIIELLAAIPSVVYGFFGVMVIVPGIRDNLGGVGKSLLAGVIILSIMILPTIISISENSLRSVPTSYYEGAIALGTTKNEAIFKVVVPSAKSGIAASYILGIGRALGETMAIILVVGNNPSIPSSLLSPVRTLTAGIAMEINYASGLHQQALFGIGVILFIFILVLNVVLSKVIKKEVANAKVR